MIIEQLKTLAEMQTKDDKIGRLRILQTELPKQLSDIIERVDQATANLLNSEGLKAELSKKQRAIEADIKQHQEQIKKYGNQLSEIKTNKEYKALNSEIAYLKEKISELESQELELMDTENAIKAQIDVDKKELADAEKEKADREGELRAQIETLETEIETTRAERNRIAAILPHSLIKQYGNMIKNKGNRAVAFSRDGACGGCGFVIRPQIRIELQLRKKIITCESCGRILMDPLPESE